MSIVQVRNTVDLIDYFVMNECEGYDQLIDNRDVFRYYSGLKLTPLKKVLRGSKSTFMTFDSETKDGLVGKEMFCWALTYPIKERIGKKYVSKLITKEGNESLDELFEVLLNWKDKTHAKIIYVHNLSFDIRFIVEWLSKHEIKGIPICSGSNMIAYSIKDKEKGLNFKFVDSFQFLQESQENAEINWEIENETKKWQTKALMKVLFENKLYKSKVKPFKLWSNEEKKELRLHCRNDTVSLYKIMVKFREMMKEIGKTDILTVISTSSLAMKVFRRIINESLENPFLYLKRNENEGRGLGYKREIIPNLEIETYGCKYKDEFVRESYFGGRTELYDLMKHKNAVYIDKVSMYGAEMERNKFPSGNGYFIGRHFNEEIRQIERQFLMECIEGIHEVEGFIRCNIKCNEETCKIPLLPEKRIEKTMFTNCSKIAKVYTLPELRKAFILKYEIEPIEGLIFTESVYLFKEYINTFYKIKEESKGGKKKGAKLLINGLYGKFGQAFERKSTIDTFFLTEEEMLEYCSELEVNFYTIYDEEAHIYIVSEVYDSVSMKAYMNVCIASYTTAYARLNLFETIERLLQYNIPIFYCDTDSFTTTLKYLDKVKEIINYGYQLGNWNIEQYFKEVKFVAPKCYCSKQIVKNKETKQFEVKQKLKLKGVDRKKIEEIEEKSTSLKSVYKKIQKPIEIAEKYMKYRESLRSGKMLNSKQLCKHYSFENAKRKFNEKGQSIAWNDMNLTEQLRKSIKLECSI